MTMKDFLKRDREFTAKIGLSTEEDELYEMGLMPRSVTGSFGREDLPELKHYCERYDFHIVTFAALHGFVNRELPDANSYYLARGDSDPHLEFIYPPEIWQSILDEIEGMKKRRF